MPSGKPEFATNRPDSFTEERYRLIPGGQSCMADRGDVMVVV